MHKYECRALSSVPMNVPNSNIKLHCKVYHQKVFSHIHTHPSIIFAIDICSFINKEFHCHCTKFFNCNVQGSPLI